MEIIAIVILLIICIASIFIIPFGLPGTFIIASATLLYGFLTHFSDFPLMLPLIFFGLFIVLEIIESVLGAAMAKKFGGSKWGMAGAIVGGIAGAVLGAFVNPLLGPLSGAFLGCFIGALVFEGIRTKEWNDAYKVGLGALFGSVGAKIMKIVVAIIMVVMVSVKVI